MLKVVSGRAKFLGRERGAAADTCAYLNIPGIDGKDESVR
jgi:hypothetical protein